MNRFRQGTLMLALFATGLCVRSAPAEVRSSERQFLWQEANAAAMAAATPEGYLRAAGAYQRLVDTGVRNPVVFYNLGTGLLLAQQYEPALQALLRAERYGGSRPEITRNIEIAVAKLQKSDTLALPWTRYVFAWHYALPTALRLDLAALGFAGLWIGGSLLLWGRRRIGRAVCAVALVVLVIFGTSAATSLHGEAVAQSTPLMTTNP